MSGEPAPLRQGQAIRWSFPYPEDSADFVGVVTGWQCGQGKCRICGEETGPSDGSHYHCGRCQPAPEAHRHDRPLRRPSGLPRPVETSMSAVKELIRHGQLPAAQTCTCAACTGVRRERAPLPTGLTYRQLDYWARSGYLRPDGNNQGTGRFRTWPSSELEIAARMVRLIDLGFVVATAARLARGDLQLTADVRHELKEIQRAATRWEVELVTADDLATSDGSPPRYVGPDKPARHP